MPYSGSCSSGTVSAFRLADMKDQSPQINKQDLVAFLKKFLEEELDEKRTQGRPSSEISDLERAILMYRFLPVRELSENDVIAPGSLTELELSGKKIYILLVPQHGGLVTQFQGSPVQVLTPQSPLGEAMLGKKKGDRVEVLSSSGLRHYQVLRVL